MGELIESLETLAAARHSCRGYTDEPVEREVVERLLALAARTPSWCNTQPWHTVVTGAEETRRLSDALLASSDGFGTDFDFPPGYAGVFAERRRESGWQLYDAVGVVKGDREASTREALRNFAFFGAPHVAIVTTEGDLGVYGAIDVGLYVESFLMTATALGLGTCAQAALAARSPFLRDWFDLPQGRKVVCAIAFGHPDPAHPANGFRTRRAPLEETTRLVGFSD